MRWLARRLYEAIAARDDGKPPTWWPYRTGIFDWLADIGWPR